MKDLVSIIIPTHNVGAYIGATLDSLLAQTYEGLEIIVVDYASSDETIQVLESYTKPEGSHFDARVKYFETQDAGVSAARNVGLMLAEGTYVVFMDGDDIVEKDYIAYLLSQMADVALASCGYDMIADGVQLYASPESTTRVLSAEDMLCRLFYLINDQGYVWNKMFRRDVLLQHHILFDRDLFYGEDRKFLVDYLLHVDRVRMAPQHKYHYQMREDSAMDEKREAAASADFLTPERLERQATEVLAYIRMRKLLRKHPDAKWLCGQVGVYSALQLYSTVEAAENPSIYRCSAFRKYIRKLRFVAYYGDEDDLMLRERMLNYGRSGRVTY